MCTYIRQKAYTTCYFEEDVVVVDVALSLSVEDTSVEAEEDKGVVEEDVRHAFG